MDKAKRKGKLFSDVLLDGENILWTSQPSASPLNLFTSQDIYLIPFSVLWLGFALFWEASVLTSNGPFFFKLWGIPFVLIGLHNLIGRFIHKYWKKRHTYYAVTNLRLLILYKSLTQNPQVIHLDSIPGLNKTTGLTGLGTLTFGFASTKSKRRRGFTWYLDEEEPGFYGIANVDEVFALINEQRQMNQMQDESVQYDDSRY